MSIVGPGDVAVELRVQVHERLLQRAQPGDPHLGRREGVHPGDQPMQFAAALASRHSWWIASGVVSTGLKTTLTGIAAEPSSARGDHLRVLGDLLAASLRRRGAGCR